MESPAADYAPAVRRWMFEDAFPFWASLGLDQRHGGAVESFALDGVTLSGVGFKRARVAARQVYVFAQAEVLGWPGARAAADHVYDHLVTRFWRGPDHGWARRITTDGALLDPTPDLYDFAFALFALGWRTATAKDSAALTLAHQTLDILNRTFRHPSGAGFHAALPPGPLREQNPHMHLTEAALAVFEASGDTRFRDLANELVTLFKTRLYRDDGVLVEFFSDDWSSAPGDAGRRVEPGHQFEWAWILARHQNLCGGDNSAVIRSLVTRAERFGVDPKTHVTFNAVRDDGVVVDAGSRTWPNTERIKGWIGLHAVGGDDPRAAIGGSLALLFDRYLTPTARGCWIDSFGASGAPTAKEIPASTLYHVVLAFSEALRVAPLLLAPR